MEDRIRNKVYVGRSSRDFLNQHPSEIEGLVAASAELLATVDRLDETLTQFESSKREADAAHKEKERLQGVIHTEFLLPIAAIARGNATFNPGVASRFRAPARGGDRSVYIGTAHSILEAAGESRALFIRDGMPEGFVDELGNTLDQYAAAETAENNNRQRRIQARAELKGLSSQLMGVLKRLDGINRSRFRKEPHLLQAWKAARNVAWPVVNSKLLASGKQSRPAA